MKVVIFIYKNNQLSVLLIAITHRFLLVYHDYWITFS